MRINCCQRYLPTDHFLTLSETISGCTCNRRIMRLLRQRLLFIRLIPSKMSTLNAALCIRDRSFVFRPFFRQTSRFNSMYITTPFNLIRFYYGLSVCLIQYRFRQRIFGFNFSNMGARAINRQYVRMQRLTNSYLLLINEVILRLTRDIRALSGRSSSCPSILYG